MCGRGDTASEGAGETASLAVPSRRVIHREVSARCKAERTFQMFQDAPLRNIRDGTLHPFQKGPSDSRCSFWRVRLFPTSQPKASSLPTLGLGKAKPFGAGPERGMLISGLKMFSRPSRLGLGSALAAPHTVPGKNPLQVAGAQHLPCRWPPEPCA